MDDTQTPQRAPEPAPQAVPEPGAEEAESTGEPADPRVLAALDRLPSLDDLAVDDHVAVYDAAHDDLHDALADAATGDATDDPA